MKRNLMSLVLAGTIALAPLAGCASQQTGTDTPATTAEDGTSSEAATDVAEATDTNYIMYLGTNDKDTDEPVFTHEEAREKAKEILVKHFGGYTIQDAEGGWMDEEGNMCQEYTIVILLSDTTLEAVHAAADELLETFRQSSVLINTEPVATEFYSGNNA